MFSGLVAPPTSSTAMGSHAALKFLADLQALTRAVIPLVWSPRCRGRGRFVVIEVHPAATRIALGVPRTRRSLEGLETRVRYAQPRNNSSVS